jgi:hypothetical protein
MWLAVLLSLAPLAPAPQAPERSKDRCPYCRDEAGLMAAAGVVSHRAGSIADRTGEELAAKLPAARWLFVETAHLRWASALGESAIDARDRERVEAELTRLRAALPDVPTKPRKLDPWLRLHLQAMKGEEFYGRFQKLLRVKDADFPLERRLDRPYLGAGPFLGEKDKFEVVLHVSRENHRRFTESFSGVAVNDSFRWHFPGLHKLLVSVPVEDADLKDDRGLWPHVAHNLSHAFLCAYKHFSYDPPVWLDEGLAQALEKEIDPKSRTTEGEEGSLRDTKAPADFAAAATKLVASDKAPRLSVLMGAKDYSELGTDGSVVAWSITRFLLDAHGETFARFLAGVKGQLDSAGNPSGEDLPNLQRSLLRELWGWSPLDLDEAWRAWVRAGGHAQKE